MENNSLYELNNSTLSLLSVYVYLPKIFFNPSLLGFTNNPSPSQSIVGVSLAVSIRPFAFAFRSVDYHQLISSMCKPL
jgi:hypothetical protein